jgi:A/G-specific adenine glycosylase
VTPIHRVLPRWYLKRRRDLPWRRTRDPYAIWIAETMLQQTRSETVTRFYERFLERFPTVSSLARARESAVLAAWSGLGYYARARNLRAAARRIMEVHGGRIPRDPASLRALPGVGRYTAGAVASIAFGVPAPVVDGNVARVLARAFAIPGRFRSPRFERAVWTTAERLMPATSPGEWNQALMELGATVCTPRAPSCDRCPIRRHCSAHATSRIASFPRRARRPPIRRIRRAAIVLEERGRVLLVRRHGRNLLRGLWEFPSVDVADGMASSQLVGGELTRLGTPGSVVRTDAKIVHTIMNQRIEVEVFRAERISSSADRTADGRWFSRRALERLALSAAAAKIVAVTAPN